MVDTIPQGHHLFSPIPVGPRSTGDDEDDTDEYPWESFLFSFGDAIDARYVSETLLVPPASSYLKSICSGYVRGVASDAALTRKVTVVVSPGSSDSTYPCRHRY